MKKALIKIDFDLAELSKGGELTLNDKTEAEIVKLLKVKESIDNLLITIENALGELMAQENTKLIEKDNIKVVRKLTGRRFALDKDNPIDPKFVQEIKYPAVNVTAVEDYLGKEGKLPTGVLDNARQEKISITLINPENGGENHG